MVKFKKIILILFLLLVGYLLGNLFPSLLPFPSFPAIKQEDIRGETGLKIIVLRDNGQPVPNLEVDVGKKEGQPPLGGQQKTDQEGKALFTIQPGIYRVFFNKIGFPSDLQYPEFVPPTIIEVLESRINQQTIILKSR